MGTAIEIVLGVVIILFLHWIGHNLLIIGRILEKNQNKDEK